MQRRLALELGAKGDGVELREAREVAGAHGLGEPGHAGVGVLRQAPERALHAREEEEEHQRRRHRLREQHARGAQVGARLAAGGAEADQRRGGGEERRAHQRRGADRLRVEEVGDDEEVGEERGHRRVAVGARLEQLQPGEEHEQQDAGLPAEDGAELDPHAEHRHRSDAEHQPARGQRRALQREIHPPAVEAEREQRQPPRRAQRVRRDDQPERDHEPHQIARGDGPELRSQGMRHGTRCGLHSSA